MSLSRAHKSTETPRVDINVVPLVDVSLVLLIIFMVTTTFMKSAGMHIQLPTSSVARISGSVKQELIIGVDSQGRYWWKGTPVTERALAAGLRNEAQIMSAETRITIQGDNRSAYGRVVRAMSLAQEAGFSHLVIAARKGESANER